MLFNSIGYAFFLLVVFIVYWIIPTKFRWIILLISSYYFYTSWGPEYVAVILLTTIISYLAAIIMDSRRKKGGLSKAILFISIIICAGVLFIFKYLNFFSENIVLLFNKLSLPVQPITLKLVLPIGISFYIFQTISYLVDVYRGDIHAEKDFGIYAVYISFFPKVMQGPIEKGKKLLPQLHTHHIFRYDQASYGLKLMAWGYFKKLVLADGLSVYVNQVYNNLPSYKGLSLLLATLFFAIQLYCDFSGYTDIALGTAKLLGINLTQNFKAPYFASSIKDFWGRWHISLSSWLKDYIYIPLGGNRVGKIRHALNIMVTFLVSGLWHGASWNYVLWGGLHGIYQVIEGFLPWNSKNSTFQRNRNYHSLLCIITVPCTFLLVCLAWIFFRAATLQDAVYVLQNMFSGISHFSTYIQDCALQMGFTFMHLVYSCLPVILLFIYDLLSLKTDVIEFVSRQRFFIRWPLYIFLLLIILLFSDKGVTTEFIYMQF